MPKHDKRIPGWQVVENVVAALQKSSVQVPGLRVTQRAQLPRINDPTTTRDVDVLVEVSGPQRPIRTCIEVKNKKRPLTIEQVGCVTDLARDVEHDHFCIVSTSGFSRAARTKAAENNIQLVTLEEFERSDFWAYPRTTSLVKTGGHLLHTSLEFSEHDKATHGSQIEDALRGACPDETILEDATGSVTLTIFLSAMFNVHLQRGGQRPNDGQVVSFAIDMSNRSGTSMLVRGVRLPGPTVITCEFRFERTITEVPERRFRLGAVELVTAEMELFDRSEQVSLAKVPQPDGSTQIVMSRGPAKPPKFRP
jgi:hypothetical protein